MSDNDVMCVHPGHGGSARGPRLALAEVADELETGSQVAASQVIFAGKVYMAALKAIGPTDADAEGLFARVVAAMARMADGASIQYVDRETGELVTRPVGARTRQRAAEFLARIVEGAQAGGVRQTHVSQDVRVAHIDLTAPAVAEEHARLAALRSDAGVVAAQSDTKEAANPPTLPRAESPALGAYPAVPRSL